MQIIFHIGTHATDEGLLIRSLLRNRETLAAEGVGVPGPSRYRGLIGRCSTELRGAEAGGETEAILLEAIRDDESAHRVILSNDNFLCRETYAIGTERLYPRVHKAAWLAACFPSCAPVFALAIRNPASYLPDLVARGADPPGAGLRQGALWSDVVLRLTDACPEAPVVVWCHEDAPLIWPDVMRALADLDDGFALHGTEDLAARLMTATGRARLRELVDRHPEMTPRQRRRAVADLFEAHADAAAVSQEIDLPDWTLSTVERLTEEYDADVERIGALPGVRLIEP